PYASLPSFPTRRSSDLMRNLARCLALTILALVLAVPFTLGDKAPELLPNRPKVPGKLRLQLRERRETQPGSGQYQVHHRSVDWEDRKSTRLNSSHLGIS